MGNKVFFQKRNTRDKKIATEIRELSSLKEEGILTGISGAANVLASIRIAEQLGEGKRVVTVVCDTGERYLSVNLEQ